MAELTSPSVEQYLLTFGPRDTLWARCPNGIAYCDISVSQQLCNKLGQGYLTNAVAYPAVALPKTPAALGTDDASRDLVSDLAIKADEVLEPYVVYRRGDMTYHKTYKPQPADRLPELDKWLEGRSKESLSSAQVVADAKGGWCALSGEGEITYQSVPQALCKILEAEGRAKVQCLALGINDAFAVIFEDGSIEGELTESYPELAACIEQAYAAGTTLVYLSLDPFRVGRYFAVFSDAKIMFKLPRSAQELAKSLIEADSTTIQTETTTLPQNSEKDIDSTVPGNEATPHGFTAAVQDTVIDVLEETNKNLEEMNNESKHELARAIADGIKDTVTDIVSEILS